MFKSLTGFKDILPPDSSLLRLIEGKAKSVFEKYGFDEIHLPLLEKTELFLRSIGETTEIVEKQMYTFEDSDGEHLTLRPEGTASVVRAYIEHSLFQKEPYTKLWYSGPMFRHERPQKGRFRQFYQIGAEVFGLEGPLIDAELLDMFMQFFEELGVKDLEVQVNSLGCKKCRPDYTKKLASFFKKNVKGLCEDHQKKVTQNPLRIMDCKKDPCRESSSRAPSIPESLCQDCHRHFEDFKNNLKALGIPFVVNARIVRGLDYYTRTAFEVISQGLGAQNAVAAGGRYDDLVGEMGGPATAAIGFALGVDRLLSLVGPLKEKRRLEVFVAILGEDGYSKAMVLIHQLRRKGVSAERDDWRPGLGKAPSLKSQMRRAEKLGARYVVIVGGEELKRQNIVIRDMEKKEQQEIEWTISVDYLNKLIQSPSGSPGD